jgi:YebC/PmpR family DNA-binding regulatory protein
MSGHSKWHNIRVKKTAADAARGKIFTRHAKLIEIVAQRGGDPTMNPSLRTAIDNAKADSVPNANIERAIKKGTGELKGERMEEIVYAAILPVRSSVGAEAGGTGVAFLIECLTDNKNRTLSNVRNIISKNGGNFAESSSVLWMFARKGVVAARNEQLKMQNSKLSEETELELIDFGAEDIDIDEDMITVTTDAANWTKVRDFLKSNGYVIESAGLQFVATQKVSITDAEKAQSIADFMAAIEEDDDVSQVFTNAALE